MLSCCAPRERVEFASLDYLDFPARSPIFRYTFSDGDSFVARVTNQEHFQWNIDAGFTQKIFFVNCFPIVGEDFEEMKVYFISKKNS